MEEIAKTQSIELGNLLVDDACRIIETARDYAYRAVNTALTIRNWQSGERIAREHLEDNGRAEYGKQVMATLATILTQKYGKGFDFSSLYQYMKFYHCFPEILDAVSPKSEKVDAVSQQLLPWTLYRELIRVEDAKARKWYEQEALREMCVNERLSTRQLDRQIDSALYERTQVSQPKLSTLLREIAPEAERVFRDQYVMEFITGKEAKPENNLRRALLKRCSLGPVRFIDYSERNFDVHSDIDDCLGASCDEGPFGINPKKIYAYEFVTVTWFLTQN